MSLLALDEFFEIDPDEPDAEKFDFFELSTSIFVSIIILPILILLWFLWNFLVLLFRKILLYIHNTCIPLYV